ncbi:Hypothetical predicted protein [Olea europaea subsp. europaea]|uniref:Uncharacterized protein n=1 Tax=Olea europaea subsp. europaea TaxID=158383 RepID=A0A8S0UVL0_OLEEU|nr:Hypothetical predicted protein [Olea europaea subsp. europaea]
MKMKLALVIGFVYNRVSDLVRPCYCWLWLRLRLRLRLRLWTLGVSCEARGLHTVGRIPDSLDFILQASDDKAVDEDEWDVNKLRKNFIEIKYG